MEALTSEKRKPGPRPKLGPKAKARAYAVYPINEAAIRIWAEARGSDSESAALREMVMKAMTDEFGDDWTSRLEVA